MLCLTIRQPYVAMLLTGEKPFLGRTSMEIVLKVVNAVCRDSGYEPPIVCTPEELVTP